MPVPVVVVKGYECPHFVGEGSLVFAVSYSGNTEETLQAVTDGAVNGARVVAHAWSDLAFKSTKEALEDFLEGGPEGPPLRTQTL